VEGGAAAFPDNECGEVNRYGFVFGRKRVASIQSNGIPHLDFSDVFNLFVKIYWCATTFFERIHFKGDIFVEAKLMTILGQSLPFIPWENLAVQDFRSSDREISASQIVAAENLRANVLVLTQELFNELCWPLWQSDENFPSAVLNQYLGRTLEGMRLR